MTDGIVPGRARPRANYPHARLAEGLIFVSGTSSRRPDDSIAGAVDDGEGGLRLDIREQTEAVLANIAAILAPFGAGLGELREATCFLVDMADFAGFNEVWNRHFDAATGPARTTVAVRELPHPHLLVEIRAVAGMPEK